MNMNKYIQAATIALVIATAGLMTLRLHNRYFPNSSFATMAFVFLILSGVLGNAIDYLSDAIYHVFRKES